MDDEGAAKLAALRREYAARLPQRARSMAVLLDAIALGGDREALVELHRSAHNLAGSGASYGFPQVSTAARGVEHALEPLLVGTPLGPEVLHTVRAAVAELTTVCDSCGASE